ncbi:MAG: site-specific integrase [Magnetococcales bacterium]|nr:site-specific integrase [Magnetococcales bacterium]
MKAKYWRTEALGDQPERTWNEAVVKYLQETEHKASREKDIQMLRWLDQHFRDKLLSQITRTEVQRVATIKCQEKLVGRRPFKDGDPPPEHGTVKTTEKATVNRYLALVRAILNKAEGEWEWITRSPKITLFKEPTRRIRWLTQDEAARLIGALPPHLASMARFSLATGLRETNVTQLEWSQTDMQRKMAWIHPDQSKVKKALAIPLNTTAIEILRNQVGQHPRFVFTFRGSPVLRANNSAWRNGLKKAGIEDFRWHDLRHTWASWHVQNGTPLNVLQELGGWESVEMVRRYAHLGGQHLAKYAELV